MRAHLCLKDCNIPASNSKEYSLHLLLTGHTRSGDSMQYKTLVENWCEVIFVIASGAGPAHFCYGITLNVTTSHLRSLGRSDRPYCTTYSSLTGSTACSSNNISIHHQNNTVCTVPVLGPHFTKAYVKLLLLYQCMQSENPTDAVLSGTWCVLHPAAFCLRVLC